jgi:hypothetical protein
MMENYIILKLKTEFIFWKIIIIHFLNVVTDPRLRYLVVLCLIANPPTLQIQNKKHWFQYSEWVNWFRI